jgi:hypothetical protein
MRASGRSRAGCWISFVIIGLAVTACTSPPGAVTAANGTRPDHPTTTQQGAPASTTTSAAQPVSPIVDSCPPGCQYQSDADAVTVLASSATRVAVVTVTSTGEATSPSVVARTDIVLQGNPHALIYPATDVDVDRLLGSKQVAAGQSYVVFASYNRGGACLSALFSYDPASQVASLIDSEDGLSNQIVLSGRVLSVPHSISLTDLQARMYPTTGVVYPSDAAEWYCPGP